ncbi:MAG: response regulator, partial [Rhodobacterales bacterium]
MPHPLAPPLPDGPAPLRLGRPVQPLRGLTILAVEDSRFACEALRLLCLRSDARLRRAESLEQADRHLSVYSPDVVIVDLGLPDGNGADLIRRLARQRCPGLAVLGTSGDPAGQTAALAAGAAGFLPKPIESLAGFQATVLG